MRGGRRIRRLRRTHTLLPLRTTHLSNSLTCWYCDFKITALNDSLFTFGHRNARFLRIWFSVGIGFSLVALVGVTLMLIWDLFRAWRPYSGGVELNDLPAGLLFGFSPLVPGLSVSFTDAGYMIFSTLISVAVHEFGHAIAAASEGIQMEYIALFLAVLFPGALVAFNNELLQNLPHSAGLRIYCAGIWHNAVFCAVCGLAMLLLPFILFPLYVHGESPMVLGISSKSPLYGYLSPGDVIVSLDGLRIREPKEWMERIALMDSQRLQNSNNSRYNRSYLEKGRRGYCIPGSLMEESKSSKLADELLSCPTELTAFETVPCFNSILLDDGNSEHAEQDGLENTYCLSAKDVVKLKKCGDGWPVMQTDGSNCSCSQEEVCLMPVSMQSLTWIEISYSSPYSSGCFHPQENLSLVSGRTTSEALNCGGTFVFVGDVLSMANSIQLIAYRPRWPFLLGASLPGVVEKMLAYTFHVSITLSLLNSLPVFFLDGESILELTFGHLAWLSPGKRSQVLQICLLGGTLLSIIALSRIFLSIFL